MNTYASTASGAFQEAQRDLRGVLASAERQSLPWLADRLPRFINPTI